MSWIQALCETYDNYFSVIPRDDPHPLVPVGFIEKELNLRVNLSADGDFLSASVLEDKARLPVPSSPAAEGKTGSSVIAYPLCDELRYVSGDLSDYSAADHSVYHEAYIAQLSSWCEADGAPDELRTLLHYLEKNRLVEDLISAGVLFVGEDGRLLEKWSDKKSTPVFFRLGKAAEKCVVDFAVQQNERFVPLREEKAVQESWQSYLLSSFSGQRLCYCSGELEPAVYNHAKIEGNAKLISSKDGPRDFQFKGRFADAEQAFSVSYIASAKAHNTLRWLRSRQGFCRYGSTFITWSTACHEVLSLQSDAEECWGASDEDEMSHSPQTAQEYANQVNMAMKGYRSAPAYKVGAQIVMLGMMAATPGRMSITFYQELDGSKYLELLENWYVGCCWRLVRKSEKTGRNEEYVTTPNLRELGEAVFGTDNMNTAANDPKGDKSITKLIRSFNAKILSCIAGGKPVPETAARSAFRRACRPEAFTNKTGKWQRADWLRCLAVTCAMNKRSNEEDMKMPQTNRLPEISHIFGRLTAVADCIEIEAMIGSDNEHRQTNAIRYFSIMQQRPASTWVQLENKLIPYMTKLRNRFEYSQSLRQRITLEKKYRSLLDDIIRSFEAGEIAYNGKLSPHFLEGYHCQRYEILKNMKENTK